MGCMCADCKYNYVVEDNHEDLHTICVCKESEKFLSKVSIVWDSCDYGEVDMGESEDTE